jgi:serine/threonine-protein kinase
MTDSHTGRLESALAGRYKIQRKLGEGGMANVYLAEDVKHERNVALKILKPELAAVIGAERFLAEIKTTANLQHPHILPLFDSGEADGFLYYVMPYIDGETLAQKLARERQLGVDEAVKIARDVSDALDYAHRNDVLHRDIKPGNILLHDRRPVVADFGIAVAISAAGGGRMTETGLSLGTPHYMSPEQASADRDLNARSDVYSLGCVLYEMIAGQPPHTGPSAQSILVRILTESPRPLTEMRQTVPPNVAATVMKAIEKLPADRFESARDFMEALEDPAFTHTPAEPSATGTAQTAASSFRVTAAPWHRDLRVLASLAIAVAALAFAFLRVGGSDVPPLPVTRATVDLGALVVPSMDEVVISPDGSKFAVVARDGDGAAHVYWRNAWEEEFRMIPGTENARFADFSPQGDWIVFRQSRPEALMKVALAGGAPVPIVPAGLQSTRDAHWSEDGTVVFAGPQGRGLFRVSANGGEPEALDEELAVREPHLLPGGRYIAAGTLDTELILFDLEGDSVIPLGRTGMNPSYVDTGHLLYVDLSGQLWAAPLDLRTGALAQGVPIQGGIYTSRGLFARYSVSRTGTAVFGFGGNGTVASEEAELVVVDQTGGVTPLPLSPRNLDEVRWSPDGDEVAFTSAEAPGDPPQIFTYDVALRTTPRQITHEGFNVSPVWSPDGTAIAFASRRGGTQGMDVFVKTLGNDDPPQIVATLEDDQLSRHWPRENALVVSDGDLWIMDLTGDSATLAPYLDTEAALRSAQVDPLGEYAVYVTQDAPASPPEIFGRRFPEAGQPTRIFERSGSTPVWAPSGDAVFLLSISGRGHEILRADIARDPLRVLSRSVIEVEGGVFERWLDIHPDGNRFLMIRTRAPRDPGEEASAPERHVVVVNWLDELRARLGGASR